jgi:hypothetical protein
MKFNRKQINEITSSLIGKPNELELLGWPQRSIKEIIINDLKSHKPKIRMYEPPKEYWILKGKDLEDYHLDYRKRAWAKTVKSLDTAEQTNDTKSLHQIARQISKNGNKQAPPVNSIINQNGTTINDYKEQGELI